MKNVHPVYGAGIRTHNLCNISPLPYPLDQGSLPTVMECLPNIYETVVFLMVMAQDRLLYSFNMYLLPTIPYLGRYKDLAL